MKTIYKLLAITVFCAIFAIAASAKTVQITDFGAIPDDGEDDTSAVRQALEDLAGNGGGTMIFPSGVTEFAGNAEFNPSYKISLRMVGDKGSYIKLNGDRETNFFTIFSASQVEFQDLKFIADSAVEMNAKRVIWVREATQTKISNCEFIGVGAFDAIIQVEKTMATVEDTIFSGSASENGAIVAVCAKNLAIYNTAFQNEGEYMGAAVNKSNYISAQHWVKVVNQNEIGKGAIRIKDSTFDTGVFKSVYVENQASVMFDGATFNISPKKLSSAVNLNNVGYSEVINSTFDGESREPRAFELSNGTYLELNAVSMFGNVIFGNVDESSWFFVRYCPSCRVPELSARK